jgi:NAD(P)-dependent dehydrogenase (short-subunit alcohol dehydrogenase family)
MQLTTNRRFLITGAAGGIAESIVSTFAEAGARLALADLNLDAVRARAEPHDAVALEADLTDPEATRGMVRQVVDHLGGLDGLIHTTGGFAMGPADTIDAKLYDKMLDLNLRSLVVTAGAVLPVLIEQGGGLVAAFSAGPAWHRAGGGGMSVYAAAKAAVQAYLHAVQDELGERGISAAVVYPMGVVDTPGNRDAMPDADRSAWIDPAEIARGLLAAAVSGPRGQLRELPVFPPPAN